MSSVNGHKGTWEDLICLNSGTEKIFQPLGPASEYLSSDTQMNWWANLDYASQLSLDTSPLPDTQDREGYFGSNHFSYWASGLVDSKLLLDAARRLGLHNPNCFLDLGSATGRVTRHMPLLRPSLKTIGCDINRFHVEWCNKYLPQNIITFQNHSIPTLPLEDNSVDIVSAFSVFTHIEALETAWLMEIRRILRPGGIAWITVHTEHTLTDMMPDWPLWAPVMEHPSIAELVAMPKRTFTADRLVLRWMANQSYSSNVFYKENYIRASWGRVLEIVEFHRRLPLYQDVVIFRK